MTESDHKFCNVYEPQNPTEKATGLVCLSHLTLECPTCHKADKAHGYNNRWFDGSSQPHAAVLAEIDRLTEENEKLRGMIVQKLDLKKGDILVISSTPPMSVEEMDRVRRQLSDVCGGKVTVMCISPCIDSVTVLSPPKVEDDAG